MIKRRTLQVSSSKHSIKKDMLFSLGQIEIALGGQGGSPPPPSPSLGYAPAKDPRIHPLDICSCYVSNAGNSSIESSI